MRHTRYKNPPKVLLLLTAVKCCHSFCFYLRKLLHLMRVCTLLLLFSHCFYIVFSLFNFNVATYNPAFLFKVPLVCWWSVWAEMWMIPWLLACLFVCCHFPPLFGMYTLLAPEEVFGRFWSEKQEGTLWLCEWQHPDLTRVHVICKNPSIRRSVWLLYSCNLLMSVYWCLLSIFFFTFVICICFLFVINVVPCVISHEIYKTLGVACGTFS